jgi:hypothetical protein
MKQGTLSRTRGGTISGSLELNKNGYWEYSMATILLTGPSCLNTIEAFVIGIHKAPRSARKPVGLSKLKGDNIK